MKKLIFSAVAAFVVSTYTSDKKIEHYGQRPDPDKAILQLANLTKHNVKIRLFFFPQQSQALLIEPSSRTHYQIPKFLAGYLLQVGHGSIQRIVMKEATPKDIYFLSIVQDKDEVAALLTYSTAKIDPSDGWSI